MAINFVTIDRNTPMLLPIDLRDWVEDDDLVHFIVDVSLRVSDGSASVNHRGCGSAQYPPSMMLALLLYCYSQGILQFAKGRTGHLFQCVGALSDSQSSPRP